MKTLPKIRDLPPVDRPREKLKVKGLQLKLITLQSTLQLYLNT